MAGNYEECWDEFRRRTFPRYKLFVNLFAEKYASVFSEATSFLGIGSGDGDFDEMIIRDLTPKLSHYYGVEIDKDLANTLEKKISKIEDRNIKVDVHNGIMESYAGPENGTDLIVMCAVAYYIKDKQQMVRLAMDWLKPGGLFIMIHWPYGTPIAKGQETIRKANEAPIDSSFDGAPLLKEMNINFEEYKLDVPFDVTEEGLEKVLRVVCHRVPTESESKTFSDYFEKNSVKKNGKRYVDMPYSILVLRKT